MSVDGPDFDDYTTLAEDDAVICEGKNCHLKNNNSSINYFDYKRFLPKNTNIKTEDDFLTLVNAGKGKDEQTLQNYINGDWREVEKEAERVAEEERKKEVIYYGNGYNCVSKITIGECEKKYESDEFSSNKDYTPGGWLKCGYDGYNESYICNKEEYEEQSKVLEKIEKAKSKYNSKLNAEVAKKNAYKKSIDYDNLYNLSNYNVVDFASKGVFIDYEQDIGKKILYMTLGIPLKKNRENVCLY